MKSFTEVASELGSGPLGTKLDPAAIEPGAQSGYQLATLDKDDLLVKKPIPVKVEKSNGGYTVGFVAADVWASGQTPFSAIAMLEDSIVAVFHVLSKHQDELHPRMAKQFAVLQEYIQRA